MSGGSILACRGSGRHIVVLKKDSDIFNAHLKSMGDLAPSRSTPRLPPLDLNEALAIAQRMLEEKTTEYLADVKAYKARTSHLESMLAVSEIRPDGSSSSAPLLEAEDVDQAPLMVHTSVQAGKDAAVEQARATNLHALELSTTNKELQRELEVLRQNPFEAKNQALRQEMEGCNTNYVRQINILQIITPPERICKNFKKKIQNSRNISRRC